MLIFFFTFRMKDLKAEMYQIKQNQTRNKLNARTEVTDDFYIRVFFLDGHYELIVPLCASTFASREQFKSIRNAETIMIDSRFPTLTVYPGRTLRQLSADRNLEHICTFARCRQLTSYNYQSSFRFSFII